MRNNNIQTELEIFAVDIANSIEEKFTKLYTLLVVISVIFITLLVIMSAMLMYTIYRVDSLGHQEIVFIENPATISE